MKPVTILVLAFDGATLLDIISSAEVFDVANKHIIPKSSAKYETVIASAKGVPVRASSGIVINAVDWDGIDIETVDTVIVPGGGPPTNPPAPKLVVEKLQEIAPNVRRICSVCTGTFILGAAGLLDGRRVATHWLAADLFSETFPNAQLDVNSIFAQDGNLWSSAGFTAGMDMALALLEQDHGYQTAITMARLMVMFLKRSEGQSQFSEPLAMQLRGGDDFSELHAWVADNLRAKLTVEALAEKMGMTTRTFARHYNEKVGQTPAKTITRFRLDAACKLLAETTKSSKEIANRVGFGDEQNMRRTFTRTFGVSPGHYRQRFSPRGLNLN